MKVWQKAGQEKLLPSAQRKLRILATSSGVGGPHTALVARCMQQHHELQLSQKPTRCTSKL